MKYITVEAETYEAAVKKARELYGNSLRIHSRKDYSKSKLFGLGKQTSCEITCFLLDEDEKTEKPKVEEKEVVTEEKQPQMPKVPEKSSKGKTQQLSLEFPEDKNISHELLEYTDSLMDLNDFSSEYKKWMRGQVSTMLERALPDVPTKADIQLSVADKIAMSIDIDHKSQSNLPALTVLVGPPASGKTTCAAKMTAVNLNKKVGFISTDSQVNSWEQVEKLSKALKIDVRQGFDQKSLSQAVSDFKDKDCTIVDTQSLKTGSTSLPQPVYDIFKSLVTYKAKFYAVIPASMKNSDIESFFKLYSEIDFKGLIVTKDDETTTMGNIISVCRDRKMPLVFVSSGKKIPSDFKKATSFALLSKLNGFDIDFASYSC